jgi:hypothetical protein
VRDAALEASRDLETERRDSIGELKARAATFDRANAAIASLTPGSRNG